MNDAVSETPDSAEQHYDDKYRRSGYFTYRTWLYRPYIRALATKARLKPGDRVLDAGCGQGFFSSLFGKMGFETLGIDISSQGIRSANAEYGSPNTKFRKGDLRSFTITNEFDCVYTRSCSLYNTADFERSRDITTLLLKMVRIGGVLVFDYYTNLCPRDRSATWAYHSLQSTREHFRRFSGAKVYFSLRLETMVLGRLAFTPAVSAVNALFGKTTGIGGDLVAFVRKT